MKQFIYYIGFLVCTSFMFSCEDVIELDLSEGEVGLVVDGMVTTLDGPQEIRLTLTTGFNDDGSTPKVTGASLSVMDDIGGVFPFSETEPGKYESAASFKGVIGRTYYVKFSYNGKDYESTKEMIQKSPLIENIRYEFLEDDLLKEDGYYVYFDFQDSLAEKNTYRFVQTYNDTLANQPSDIIVFNDEFTPGVYFKDFTVNDVLQVGDKYKIEIWTLSTRAGDFLSELEDQASGTGGPFDVPPAPIYGNVFNVNDPNELVWGYFSASDISSDSVTIVP